MAVTPMLAVKADDLEALPYPLLASVKLDGIRCLITPDGPQTRSGEAIPNLHVRRKLSELPVGLDGELVCLDANGVPDFRLTTGNIRRESGEPEFVYYVFDNYLMDGGFNDRACDLAIELELEEWDGHWCRWLWHRVVNGPEDVRREFAKALADGQEGLILRHPEGLYKHGRSTLKEAGMLKVKPYEDAEAVIISVFEREHNTNVATKSKLGRSKRADTKDAKEPTGLLGGFWVMLLTTSGPGSHTRFKVSAGKTTHAEKADLWARRVDLIGRVIRFQYVTVGGYDVPRHATFQGFREAWDMGEPKG